MQRVEITNMFKKLLSVEKKNKYGFFGDYSSWSKVGAIAEGYDKPVILEKTTNSLLKVKNGEAVYERDSVLFNATEIPYSLMAYLILSASLKKRPLNILDFGGSLGSTYYQLKDILPRDTFFRWNVVEQEHVVSCGKTNFEDDVLRFYSSIDKCVAEQEIDFVLLSSCVQYLESPHAFLQSLVQYDFDFILFDRTAFNSANNDRLTLQIVPPEIYPATYPAWFFHEDFFLSHFSERYKVIAEFPSYVKGEACVLIDNRPLGTTKGFYLMNASKYA